MKYQIGSSYDICPHGRENYRAICVGYVRFENKNKYPVFKFDFYAYPPKLCYLALDEEDRWLAGGHSHEEMIENFKSQLNFYGTSYKAIKIGEHELSKEEFVKQASEAGVKIQDIHETLLRGYFLTCYPQEGGGEIKWCPKCNQIRHTSCSACGCGNCDVCEHRWCCRGDEPNQFIMDGVPLDELPAWGYIGDGPFTFKPLG